jgi:hypothetical protein
MSDNFVPFGGFLSPLSACDPHFDPGNTTGMGGSPSPTQMLIGRYSVHPVHPQVLPSFHIF